MAVGAAARPVLPAQLPRQPARPELPPPGRARRGAGQPALLAGSRRGRLPPRLDQLLLPRRAAARQPGEAEGDAQRPRLQRGQPLRVPVPLPQQHAAGEPRVPAGPARVDGPLPRHRHAGRNLLRGFAGDDGRVHQRPPPAHGLQLRAAHPRLQRRAYPRHRARAGGEDDRRLAVLGDFQPRRGARAQPLGQGWRLRRDGEPAHRDGLLAARLGLRVPGRRTRPDRGRAALRIVARSLRHRVLAGVQGPRRLPHADAVERRRARRFQQRRAVAAGAARASRAERGEAASGPRLRVERLPPLHALAPRPARAAPRQHPLPRYVGAGAGVRARAGR